VDPVTKARAWLQEHGAADVTADSLAEAEAAAGDRLRPTPLADPVGPGPVGPDSVGHDHRLSEGEGARRAAGRDNEPDADPETVARTIVLRKLAAQGRTRQELAKALASRQVPDDVATRVLDRMESVGLVDDATFARDWVQSRQQRRHLSKSALRRELQGKGVEREVVDEAVAGVEGSDELCAAEALALKKLRTMGGLSREVRYRRLAGALARRGFAPGVTSSVLSRLLGSDED